MSAAVAITRIDQGAGELRRFAAKTADAAQARRLLAIAKILEGASRLDAARQAGMDRQTLRDWVHRYNEAGIEGVISRKPPGATAKLTKAQMAEFRALVIAGLIHRSIRSSAGAALICARKWPDVSRSQCQNARLANGWAN